MSEETRVGKFYVYLDMGDILDQDQLDRLTRQLQNELLDQNVEDAGLVSSDEIPVGAKAAEAITWGALAIEVLPTFLPAVVEFLKSWVMREKSRKIKIRTQVGENSIELEYSSMGIKNEEVKDLVSILAASLREKTEESEALEESETIDAEQQVEEPMKEGGAEEPKQEEKTEDQVIDEQEPSSGEEETEAQPTEDHPGEVAEELGGET